jgi:hypothetical protein
MLTKRIGNRRVKDIFEELLGRENSRMVLKKIQAEFDKGVRGDALKEFAQKAIGEIPGVHPESAKIVVAIVAIVVI